MVFLSGRLCVGRSRAPRSVKEGAMSTLMELTIVLLICPAALAAWVDARYPGLRPSELRSTAIHLGVTGLLAFVVLRPRPPRGEARRRRAGKGRPPLDRPDQTAISRRTAAASARFFACSLRRIDFTCQRTVSRDRQSAPAVWAVP